MRFHPPEFLPPHNNRSTPSTRQGTLDSISKFTLASTDPAERGSAPGPAMGRRVRPGTARRNSRSDLWVTLRFCEACDRTRLTADRWGPQLALSPEPETDLRSLLCDGAGDDQIVIWDGDVAQEGRP